MGKFVSPMILYLTQASHAPQLLEWHVAQGYVHSLQIYAVF